MNKKYNPTLLNTVVSGPGMKYPRKPLVLLGNDGEFAQGDLMDANAVLEAIDDAISGESGISVKLNKEIQDRINAVNQLESEIASIGPATQNTPGLVQPRHSGTTNKSGLLITDDSGSIQINTRRELGLYIDGVGLLKANILDAATTEEINNGTSTDKALTPSNMSALKEKITEDSVTGATYDSNAKKIYLKHGNNVLAFIDTTDFIKDGMVNDATISNDNLVITFNTDAGKQPISIPLSQIFNPNNYYTKTEVNNALTTKANLTNGLVPNNELPKADAAGTTAGIVKLRTNGQGANQSGLAVSSDGGIWVYANSGLRIDEVGRLDTNLEENGGLEFGSNNGIQMKTATGTDVEAGTSTDKALTPSNINLLKTVITAENAARITTIENGLSNYVTGGSYNSETKEIELKHNNTVLASIDATAFITNGVVDSVVIENGNLVITFNTELGEETVSIPLSLIFDPSNYYNKSEIDAALGNKQDIISDLADIRSGAQAGSTALQEHQSLDAYAKNNGYYEGMGVGTADNLTGQTERTDDTMYRKTGGSEEVATGTATISNIKGQTVAWNQLFNINQVDDTSTGGITITKNNNALNVIGYNSSGNWLYLSLFNHLLCLANHKYCVIIASISQCRLRDSQSGQIYGTSSIIIRSSNWSLSLAVPNGVDINESITFGVFDLTLIYGAGNEPSTVAQFEADYFKWFGKPLDYEDYDAGSLKSVQLDSLKTTGFNQYNNGQARVIGGLQYQITGTYTTITLNDETITPDANGLFTPSTTGTLIIVGGGSDTCIHISGDRNGEYEPYEGHSVSLPVTTMTGKLNGEGESVVVFPDGMKSAGSVYDEIYTVGDKTYAVKRIGSVNMGSLNWSRSSVYFTFINLSPLAKSTYNNVCPIYRTVPLPVLTSNMDKTLGVASTTIYVRDSSYTDVTTFKAAMNGVMLYYELTTPLIYELDTFDLPKVCQVDGDGTEEQIQKSGVQGLAAILTCIYGVDAVKILDKLPQNYISEKSMDNFLAQLNTVTGGTWTKTWNENTGEWDFSFTPNAQTDDINTDETI